MKLQLALDYFREIGYEPSQFFLDLAANGARSALFMTALPSILDCALHSAPDIARAWALEISTQIYRQEILATAAADAGFHTNAAHLQPKQVEQFNLADLALKLQLLAPHLWKLFLCLLEPKRQRTVAQSQQRIVDRGGDLGGEGDRLAPGPGTRSPSPDRDAMDVDLEPVSGGPGSVGPESSETVSDPTSGIADAYEIKAVTAIGILQQSVTQRCNAVQANMGLFLRLTHVPDAVVSVLNHIGASTSNATIGRSCDSLDQICEDLLGQEGPTLTTQEAYDNFNFKQKVAVPIPGRGDVFVSATSAIALRSHPCLSKEDFRHAKLVWSLNPANLVPRLPGEPSPYRATYFEVLQLPAVLDPRRQRTGPAQAQKLPHALSMNAWHIRRILFAQCEVMAGFKAALGDPDVVLSIPLHKTEYLPMRAMELNQSTTQGNIHALEKMFNQIKYPKDAAEEYVTFVHADLGGCERIHSAQSDRCDEDCAIDRFQNVVNCPGLFHMKMAATDAIYRIHLNKSAARHSESCVWKYVCRLRPQAGEQAKFASQQGPGYRRMHDVSRHVTWALILEAWTLEIERWSGGYCTSITEFAKLLEVYPTERATEIIQSLSVVIARTYVAGPGFSETRPLARRDLVFDNWRLWLSHALLDEELDLSIKQMDVGRVCLCLWQWMFIFQATGKHTYARHTLRVLVNIAYVFPKPLARAFLMSWIINPTGKLGGGRGVDWLVELFNLYLKSVHSGSSSNHGIKRIVKISTLISIFKFVFDNFILNYRILSRTVRHAPPNMTETIENLRRTMHADRALHYVAGRGTPYRIPNALAIGQDAFQSGGAGDLSGHAPTASGDDNEVSDAESDFFDD